MRESRVGDAFGIWQLNTVLGYTATEDEIRARLGQLLTSSNHSVAVATSICGHEVIGWIAAEFRLILEFGRRVDIVGWVVSNTHRRKGVGRELVSHIHGWATTRQVDRIRVQSNVEREDAHEFYSRIGFREIKRQSAYLQEINSVSNQNRRG